MNRFAALLDRLAYEPSRNAKLRQMTDYFRTTPDPERGYALAALTGALSFQHAKPGLIRTLIAERTDPALFEMSYDYVGDLSETVALMWPTKSPRQPAPSPRALNAPSPLAGEGWGVAGEGWGGGSLVDAEEDGPPPSRTATRSDLPRKGGGNRENAASTSQPQLNSETSPSLAEVVTTLQRLGKAELPAKLAHWLDGLDETGRWALLKLVTGGLRVGVSARLAKTAVAALGDKDPDEVEILWPGLVPPYGALFAWVEGRADKPFSDDPAPFRPPMLAHPIAADDFAALAPGEFIAEWKWDGIRVQAAAGTCPDGRRVTRLFSRTGEDISGAFPDLLEALRVDAAIDGELLIRRDGRVQSFNVLQQRLNRKAVTAKLIIDFPAHLRAYDLLVEGDEDLRGLPLTERRARLAALIQKLEEPRIDLSPEIPFADWEALARARAEPPSVGAGPDAEAIEGVMIKRRDSPYLPGRPKGPWWKWKRDPFIIDAVLMYAQRGHGKRSSYYSDYTFGVWRAGADGDELVPVGKAYFGFTDQELLQIDRFVRQHTIDRFGPVREVVHDADKGLVFEVAFEGLQRSTRHRSGLAMRFPRVSRLRLDKPPGEADRLDTLLAMLDAAEQTPVSGGRVLDPALARTGKRKGG